MEALQNFLQSKLGPLAEKLNKSELIGALTTGMMGTMPITLGISVLSILLYLPIPAWQAFLEGNGMLAMGMQALQVTSNMLAPFALISIARVYAQRKGLSDINCMVIALGVFFILLPLNVIEGEYQNTYTVPMDFLGASGLFIAMILGTLIPALYGFLIKRVGIKLPDTVPPMVTDSLSPTFVAMILFTGAFLVKWGFSLTAFGSFYAFFNSIVAAPVMSLGASPIALLVAYTFSNLLWFFGIHPAAILNVYGSAIGVALGSNVQAFLAGTPSAELPYLSFQATYALLTMGGSGVLIGLSIAMLTAKSERFKALRNIGFVPAMFNISEPLMFGMPVVLNPMFLIPMVISVPIVGGVSLLLCNLGLANGIVPVISMPWIVPTPITALIQGGVGYCAIALVGVALSVVLYYPFFRAADNAALAEEAELKAAEEAAAAGAQAA